MWAISWGTVGLAVLALILGAWMLEIAWTALTGGKADADSTSLRVVRGPSVHAPDDARRRDDGDVRPMWQEERRRELRGRLAATAKARGPARLSDRGVPNDAA